MITYLQPHLYTLQARIKIKIIKLSNANRRYILFRTTKYFSIYLTCPKHSEIIPIHSQREHTTHYKISQFSFRCRYHVISLNNKYVWMYAHFTSTSVTVYVTYPAWIVNVVSSFWPRPGSDTAQTDRLYVPSDKASKFTSLSPFATDFKFHSSSCFLCHLTSNPVTQTNSSSLQSHRHSTVTVVSPVALIYR